MSERESIKVLTDKEDEKKAIEAKYWNCKTYGNCRCYYI